MSIIAKQESSYVCMDNSTSSNPIITIYTADSVAQSRLDLDKLFKVSAGMFPHISEWWKASLDALREKRIILDGNYVALFYHPFAGITVELFRVELKAASGKSFSDLVELLLAERMELELELKICKSEVEVVTLKHSELLAK